MIAQHTAMHIYLLLNGKMLDIIIALLCFIYTFTNSSFSPRPLLSGLTLFSY